MFVTSLPKRCDKGANIHINHSVPCFEMCPRFTKMGANCLQECKTIIWVRNDKIRFKASRKQARKTKPPYTPLLYSKTGVYRGKYFFLLLLQNIDCGYSLEPPY